MLNIKIVDINITYRSYYKIILVLPQILAYLNSLQIIIILIIIYFN